jgi:hypothetical protein
MSYPLNNHSTVCDAKQSLYVEAPNGQVLQCNWLQYEQLKAMGYVHRILTANQAVLHKLSNLRKGK